jgi:hypothetical protein
MPIDEPCSADWVVEFVRERPAALLANELLNKLEIGSAK